MARFLLIHGSCHGAWCWSQTIAALQARGHAARAIDLPSHGTDATPPATVTLADYARAILAALEPGTILVGHSMGGYPITAAAELAARHSSRHSSCHTSAIRLPYAGQTPEIGPGTSSQAAPSPAEMQPRPAASSAPRLAAAPAPAGTIARLVYLCAYVPRPGHSLADMRRAAPSQPLLEAVRLAPDRATFTIDPALAVDRFYHDVPQPIAQQAVSRLCPQPVAPQETVLEMRHAPAIPRSYIRCRQDRTIPPAFQDRMTEGWPEGTVFDMDTSHSPFLSDPESLADILTRIAEG